MHDRVRKNLECWGGIESTINRVGDEFKDQLAYSQHYDRPGDIQAIADLGIRSVRYPVLWEKHQPDSKQVINWEWTDQQLYALKESGVNPIVGLVHHGSGPAFTQLSDPSFPYLLAGFAYEVASRYPWIADYTPVNEPLTTARFSGLYGLWYPHHQNEKSFYQMLLHQLKAVVLCMQAIRSVNPEARLIQTEDLGKTHSTLLLSGQAAFENDRRLLTFDILTGKLKPGHPQYAHMLHCGIPASEMHFFQDNITPPDIIGLNYYITSERWLDEHLEKYPAETHGGNGTFRYSDTEVVRAHPESRSGFKLLAMEIWKRYRLPMAVTEAHLHCTREEQMRWLKEIWDAAGELMADGVDIRAVTAWALLGSFDWDSLLTKTGTQYESGVFDIKTFSGRLRPTGLAALIKQLSSGNEFFHPVLSNKGWWHAKDSNPDVSAPRLIIVQGSDDDLALQISSAADQRRLQHIVLKSHDHINFDSSPWAIIDLAGEHELLASVCADKNIQYLGFTSIPATGTALQILTENGSLSFHQINKMLDLLIDGDRGCWIFDAGEISFKTENALLSEFIHSSL